MRRNKILDLKGFVSKGIVWVFFFKRVWEKGSKENFRYYVENYGNGLEFEILSGF